LTEGEPLNTNGIMAGVITGVLTLAVFELWVKPHINERMNNA
jgi:hypothetical protein